jgi:hypothetical protein
MVTYAHQVAYAGSAALKRIGAEAWRSIQLISAPAVGGHSLET